MKNKMFIIVIVFILLGLFITLNVQAAVTFNQAKDVWARLQNVSGFHVTLKYDSDPYSNAYTDGKAIYITDGMLKDCQNKAQIAMVLGHELGHFIKQHPRNPETKAAELEADKIGFYYCKKMYSKNSCLSFMTLMERLYGNEHDDVHPIWSYRKRQLQ
jgi:hypothetical protein